MAQWRKTLKMNTSNTTHAGNCRCSPRWNGVKSCSVSDSVTDDWVIWVVPHQMAFLLRSLLAFIFSSPNPGAGVGIGMLRGGGVSFHWNKKLQCLKFLGFLVSCFLGFFISAFLRFFVSKLQSFEVSNMYLMCLLEDIDPTLPNFHFRFSWGYRSHIQYFQTY